ncbi:MAG: MMPL family transporter [Myxococcales bacterium]|nr:MMPL family transporter [Myxococcales bacterium]
MSAPPQPRRDRWIATVLAHHRAILIFALILTAVAGLLASRLRIESDLRALLPTDHPVIESLEQIESSFVRLGSVNVVVEGGTAEQRHAYADAVAGELEALETIDDVEYRLRSDYFADHALYYLSDEEMGELDEHVQAWTHYEACSREPDLCLGEPDPKAPDQLRDFVKAKQEKALERAGFADYYEREGIDALVILAHPTRDSSDLEFSRTVSAESRAIVDAASAREGAAWSGAGLRVSVVGPYAVKADENAAIRRDMVTSGSFALVGVFLILYLLFRSFRAVFTLLIPLLCGVAWSMGATQLLLGHLNTMTSLISTVVMGMGIDAGIHFLHRVRRERQEHDDAEAITLAFRGLIIPLLIASATTLGAFVVMASSSFPAFQEFGLIAVLGVSLCLLAMVTVFPALLLLVGVKLPPPEPEHGIRAGLTRALVRRPGVVFMVVVALCVAATFGARKVAFENNGRMLQSESRRDQVERDTQLISKIFGKDIHAGILVAPSLEAARTLATSAREKHAERVKAGDTVVAELFTGSDLLPPAEIDADARKEAIETLTEDIPEHTWEKLEARAEGKDGDDKGADKDDGMTPADARRLRRMLKADAVKIDEFPPTILAKVRSKDGRYAIYAYPNFDAADIQKGVEFMDETAAYVGPDSNAQFVGETTVYAAMYLMMREEAPTIIATAAGVIVVLVLLQLRSLVLVVITLLPLVISVWWLLGLMGAFDVRFTLFNIPILPAVLGIGVDNGVYLTDRIRRLIADAGDDGLRQALRETGAAILAATTTTALGFASFIIADSGGLKGIGLVAVIGILCAAAAALLTIPAVFALIKRLRRR